MNVRSLKNKLSELRHLLYSVNPMIVLITESWLDESVPDNLLDPENMYHIYRCDRVGRSGGGTCAFISRALKCKHVVLNQNMASRLSDIDCDLICFKIIVKLVSYNFILLYLPPSSGLNKIDSHSRIVTLNSIITELTNPRETNILAGDFNLPAIDWVQNTFPADGIHDQFVDTVSTLGLHQLVINPTRISNTGTANILDLLFSSDLSAIVITNYLPPFSTSDHDTVEFAMFLPAQQESLIDSDPINLVIYDWSSGNYDAITLALHAIDWHVLFGHYFEVNDIWLQFKNIIWPLIDQYIPKKTIKHHHKYNPKKYPTSIKKLLTRKAAIWRKVKNDKTNTVIRTKYAEIANKCKIAIFNYDLEKEKKILETNNLGAFFKFANKKLSSPSGISPLMDRSGNLLTTDADKAKLLSDYFASVYTVDDGSTPPFQSRLPPDAMGINDIPISPSADKKNSW